MIILINLHKLINYLSLSDMQRVLIGTLILLEVLELRGYQVSNLCYSSLCIHNLRPMKTAFADSGSEFASIYEDLIICTFQK